MRKQRKKANCHLILDRAEYWMVDILTRQLTQLPNYSNPHDAILAFLKGCSNGLEYVRIFEEHCSKLKG